MEVQSSVDFTLCPHNAAITEALHHRKPACTRNLEFVCNKQFLSSSSSSFPIYGASLATTEFLRDEDVPSSSTYLTAQKTSSAIYCWHMQASYMLKLPWSWT